MTAAPDTSAPLPTPAGPLPADVEWRRWGLAEPFAGLLLANVAAFLVGAAILAGTSYDTYDDFPMWAIAVSTLPLHLTMVVVAVGSAEWLGGGWVRDYLVSLRGSDMPRGVITGVLAQLVLVPAVTLPILWLFGIDQDRVGETARDLSDRADSAVGVVLLVFAVGIMAPFAEELFFRGLLYGAFRKRRNLAWLERAGLPVDTMSPRWNTWVATLFSAAVFTALHPDPVTFPGLFAVGVLFARMYERHGRLPVSMWAHLGFNATTLVVLLVPRPW